MRVTPKTLLTNQKRNERPDQFKIQNSSQKESLPGVLVHAERTCSRRVGKNLLADELLHQYPLQRGGWDRDVPVELHLEEHESFHELGRALDLPFPKLAFVESAPLSPYHDGSTNWRCALPHRRRNAQIVRHENPPVGINRQRNPPRVIRSLEPKGIVQPVVRTRPINILTRISTITQAQSKQNEPINLAWRVCPNPPGFIKSFAASRLVSSSAPMLVSGFPALRARSRRIGRRECT